MSWKSFRFALIAAGAAMLASCGINSVPTKEEAAKAAWANVESAYQRRADLIPNLVSTVRGAAQIAMVKRGAVVDAGTHEALLQRSEPYVALVRRQLGGGASDTALDARLDARV